MESHEARTGAFDTRVIERDDPLFESAIALVFGGVQRFDEDIRRRFEAFEEIADRQGLRSDLLVGTFRGRELLSATLVIESPGRTAIVYMPPGLAGDDRLDALSETLASAADRAHDRGVVLVQALLSPDEGNGGSALAIAGFRFLAELIYMDRTVGCTCPNLNAQNELRFITYSDADRERYRSAVASTYVESLDCPGLSPLRDIDDVLAGHMATGVYDPRGWFLGMQGERPVGVMLLAGVPQRFAVEVVYMGVVPEVRGKGVGDGLLHRAELYAQSCDAETITLAVDSINAPARRLYSRWGFCERSRRRAWIHTHSQGCS